jgi:hypothetical protein
MNLIAIGRTLDGLRHSCDVNLLNSSADPGGQQNVGAHGADRCGAGKVTADRGAIRPGDLLTTSCVPGHAMRAEPVTLNGRPRPIGPAR